MSDLQQQINERIAAFVSEVTDLARRAAMETLSQALDQARPNGRSRRAGNGFANGHAGPWRARPGAKRSPAQIDRTTQQLRSFIGDNPGQRMEQIAKELGTTTRELSLPIRKLIAAGSVKTEGQKRATRYYPKTSAARRPVKRTSTKGRRRRRVRRAG